MQPGNSIEQFDYWCFYVMAALGVVWIVVYIVIFAGSIGDFQLERTIHL